MEEGPAAARSQQGLREKKMTKRGGGEEESIVIDVPLLLGGGRRSEECWREAEPRMIYKDWSKCCIYRVPSKLRSVNEAAYTPQLVSIGPFHYAQPKLRPMEALKSSYLRAFCARSGTTKEDLVGKINGCIEEIRECYTGTLGTHIEDSKLADIVVTDAGFIMELLLRSSEHHHPGRQAQQPEDYILSKPWLEMAVEQDLILLENQIPFFALHLISTFARPPNFLLHLTYRYFSKRHHLEKTDKFPSWQPKHFTDLLRSYFWSQPRNNEDPPETRSSCCWNKNAAMLPPQGSSSSSRRRRRRTIKGLRSATKLIEAGVEFTTGKESVNELDPEFPTGKESVSELDPEFTTGKESVNELYVEFKTGRCLRYCPCCDCSWLTNCLSCFFHCFPALKCEQATLKLPQLEVDDATECLFRNLMALEQCHYPDQMYVCNYVSLMDKLINTTEDVELLIDKKVIVNFLGSSKAVAALFNRLCQHIVEHDTCFYECVQKINEHCNNPLNRIMATLTSVYFRDFWRGTATVVGVVVLALTVWNIFLRHILKTKWH